MTGAKLRPDELPRRYYAARVDDRQVAELLGLCKGIIADGMVNDSEAIALKTWMSSHPAIAAAFPARELAARLEQVFADGIIDDAEREDLAAMLRALVGEPADQSGDMNRSAKLPLDEPEPTLFFEGKEYVFTGHFCLPRRQCEKIVTDRAGRPWSTVTRRTDYLVVGTVASEAWITAAWGRKVLHAMDLRKEGSRIAIVSETHWLATIDSGA